MPCIIALPLNSNGYREKALNTNKLFEDAEHFLRLMSGVASAWTPVLISDSDKFSTMPKYHFGYEFRGQARDYMLYGIGANDWIADGEDYINSRLKLSQQLEYIHADQLESSFYDFVDLRDDTKNTRNKYIGKLADEAIACEELFESSVFHTYVINKRLLDQGERSDFIKGIKKNQGEGLYEQMADIYLETYYPFYKHLKSHDPSTLEIYSAEIRFARLSFYIGVAQAISHHYREGNSVLAAISSHKSELRGDLNTIEKFQTLRTKLAKKLKRIGSLSYEGEALLFEESMKVTLTKELDWLKIFHTRKDGWPNTLMVIRLAHALVKEIGFPEKQVVEVIMHVFSIFHADGYDKESVKWGVKKYLDWFSRSGAEVKKSIRPDPIFAAITN